MIEIARSFLFVPGDRPDRFERAVASGADCVILDLEDAVLPDAKEGARKNVRTWLADGGKAAVRINAYGTQWHDSDLELLTSPNLLAVILPKADLAACKVFVGGLPDHLPLMPLIESARGIIEAKDLALLDQVARLTFGSVDFMLECGMADSEHALLTARSTLVIASAASGIPGPVDGVTMAIDDKKRLAGDIAHAREIGFTGKFCIHPAQVAPVNEGFRPSDHEIEAAKRIIDAVSEQDAMGAIALDGHMLDRPVIERAQKTLARANQFAGNGN